MLIKSIERLEAVLEEETAAFLSHDLSNLQEFSRRKSQSLLELSRLVRSVKGETLPPDVLSKLQKLRSKLEANNSVLEMNLRAVQEVADIISQAIQSAESDGTYSAIHPF